MKAKTGERIVTGAAALLASAALFIGMQGTAMASDGPASSAPGVTARIPVCQEFETNVEGAGDTFTYVLEAESADAPLPDGGSGGTYRFELEGDQCRELEVRSDEVAYYRYSLYQQIDEEKDRYSYDRTVYTVDLYYYTNSKGQPDCKVMAYNAKGEKADQVKFENSCWKDSAPAAGGGEDSEDSSPAQTPVKQPQQAAGIQIPTAPAGSAVGGVKTGDETAIAGPVILMAGSALLLCVLMFRRRNREEEETDASCEK